MYVYIYMYIYIYLFICTNDKEKIFGRNANNANWITHNAKHDESSIYGVLPGIQL